MTDLSEALTAYMRDAENGAQRPTLHTAKLLFDRPLEEFTVLDPVVADKLASMVVKHLSDNSSDWTPPVCILALKTLKELSRSSQCSRSLADVAGIRSLTLIASRLSSAYDQTEAYDQLDVALRILNNILFVHEGARQTFAADHEAFKLSLDLIEIEGESHLTFLGARLLFFATLKPSVVLLNAVQGMGLVDIFAKRIEELLHSNEGESAAMTELLKAFFNVSLFYPQQAKGQRVDDAIVGEKFNDVLLPILEPVLRLLTTWSYDKKPVFVSPWSNTIAVLLNYPVKPHERIWSTCAASSSLHRSRSNSQRKDSSSKSSSSSSSTAILGDADGIGVMASVRRKASSILRTSLFRTSVGGGILRDGNAEAAVVATLLNMIEAFCIRYLGSQDIDDTAAPRLAQMDDVDLELSAEPPLLLLRKLADESEQFRAEIKNRLIPANIDRSVGLDKRSDLTGILVRLMSSQNYQRLARASGEALLAICGGKATEMTAEIGYGPCAGFLMSIGQAHAMPGPHGSVEVGEGEQRQLVDPITGTVLPSDEEIARSDAERGLSPMTEDEKAAEAERLFTLFDRLDKTGVVSVDPNSHPMRKAAQSGRLQELDREQEIEDAKRAQEEDDALEKEVEREMQAYRNR